MFKLLHKIMRMAGFIPLKRETQLLREIFLLEKENESLIKDMVQVQDENGSLWDMLDEIKKSDIAEHTKNKIHLDKFMDEIKDALTDEMMKDFKPVGEA